MKLYHGTSLRNFLKIIQNGGIRPRIRSSKGNWGHTFISHSGYVYLTDTYPMFYAYSACKGNDKPIIIELEVDEDELYPDEDFIRWIIGKQNNLSMEDADLTMIEGDITIEVNKVLTMDSLKHIGSVAFKGTIPISRITRICVLWDKWIVYNNVDHVVSNPMAHQILGPRYKALIAFIFGDDVYKTHEDIFGLPENFVVKDMANRAKSHIAVFNYPIDVSKIHEYQKRKWENTQPSKQLMKEYDKQWERLE